MKVVPELSSIPHRNGIRSNTVQAFLTAGTLPSNVLSLFEKRMESIQLPPGYWLEIGGEAKERNSAVDRLLASVGVLVTLMIGAIVLTFNSFRLAGIIFSVGLLATGSGLTALWLFQCPFGFVAITGLMGLVGIAINDSIVVLSALSGRRPSSLSELVKLVQRSTRHVVSTTLTTIVGFLPLILSGEGLWPPMVIAISGGIVGGTLLALVFVPAAYRLMNRPNSVAVPQPHRAGAAAALFLVLLAPSQFVEAATDSPHQGIEATLDLPLEKAIELAISLNPRIQISNLRILEAESLRDKIRSRYRPQFGIEGSGAYSTANLGSAGLRFPGIPRRIGPFESYDFRTVFRQSILDTSLYQSIRARDKRAEQAKWESESLQQLTLLRVIQLYLDTLEAHSRLEASRARLETASLLLQQSKDFLEVGTGNRLDYSRAEIQFQRETASLAQAEQTSRISQFRLLQTIGLSPGQKVHLSSTFRLNPYTLLQEDEAELTALSSRPEVSAMQAKLQAADRELASSRSQRLTSLGFRADYGIAAEAVQRGVSTWAIAAELRIPLFEGGRIGAQVAEREIQKKQVEEETREVELEVRSEVRSALVQLETAWKVAGAASRAASAARESLELARARYGAGISNNLDVVQAQETLAAAEDFEYASLYGYQFARANLARSLGNIASFVSP